MAKDLKKLELEEKASWNKVRGQGNDDDDFFEYFKRLFYFYLSYLQPRSCGFRSSLLSFSFTSTCLVVMCKSLDIVGVYFRK